MSLSGNWNYPTPIRFGAGRIVEIADACASVGIKKPLFVTDKGMAKMEITARTRALLKDAGLGGDMFSDVDKTRRARTSRPVWRCTAMAGMTG